MTIFLLKESKEYDNYYFIEEYEALKQENQEAKEIIAELAQKCQELKRGKNV